jgi:hypothetical protein
VIRRAALLGVALVLSGCMGGSDDEPVARYLVFTKAIGRPQEAVWIGDVSGNKMRRLTRGVYGLVSPDGTQRVLVRHLHSPCERRLEAAADDGRPEQQPGLGRRWIAFAYRPPGSGCFAPRIWKMRPDGLQKQPIMKQLPRRFSSSGYYGVRPFSWVRDRPLLLATVPTEWGNELALVDSRNGSTRKPDLDPRPRYTSPMYADHASRDGRHVVGAACGAEGPCTIQIFSVIEGRAKDVYTGMASWPDWNR